MLKLISIMKITIGFKQKITTALVVCALILGACNNPIFDPGGDEGGGGGTGGGKPKCPPYVGCNTNATMVQMPCNVGIYGGLWIKTDDGQHYIPSEQSFMTICAIELKAGDRVKVGFRLLDPFKGCDNIATCFAAFPPYKPVVVDCITVVSKNPSDCPQLVVDHTDYKTNVHVIDATVVGNTLKLKVGYGGCSPKSNDAFGLSWKQAIMKSYPAQTNLQISMQNEELCQAYFTNELCFDISTIKSSYKEPIQLNIGDKTVMY